MRKGDKLFIFLRALLCTSMLLLYHLPIQFDSKSQVTYSYLSRLWPLLFKSFSPPIPCYMPSPYRCTYEYGLIMFHQWHLTYADFGELCSNVNEPMQVRCAERPKVNLFTIVFKWKTCLNDHFQRLWLVRKVLSCLFSVPYIEEAIKPMCVCMHMFGLLGVVQ